MISLFECTPGGSRLAGDSRGFTAARRLSRASPLLLLLALPGWAHEGHDHAEPPLPVAAATPRLEAASEDFELVGNLSGRSLTMYLDQYASNEPVAKAQLEVEAGKQKTMAREISPGIYQLDLADVKPGKHALVFTIQAGDAGDLLTASLEVPAAAPAIVAAKRFDWRLLGWLAVPLLGLTGWSLWRRRQANG